MRFQKQAHYKRILIVLFEYFRTLLEQNIEHGTETKSYSRTFYTVEHFIHRKLYT